MEGYIKLHRQLLESAIFANATGLKVWVWCLLKSTYKSKFISIKIGRGESTVKLEAGQFIFGRFTAEEELGIDGSTIYKWMKKFELEEMIKMDSNSHYTVVTVCNWEEYQQNEEQEVTTKEQPSNNQVTAKEQPSNTNKKDKNIKESKENNNGEKSTRFIPPTLSDIIAYCLERKNDVDPEKWFNFYSAKNWMIGKNKMKDWRAAVRTWENNSSNNNCNYGKTTNTYIGGSKAVNQDESLFCGVNH